MQRRSRGVLLLLAAFIVVGCTDTQSSGTRNLTPTAPSLFASPYPDIDQEIIALFPTGLETATGTRWVNVTNKLAAGDHVTAEKMFWELVNWMIQKSSRLDDPAGPLTALGGLNKLIGDMYAVVFPGQPRPGATGLNGDATLGLVLPNEATTIVTPTHHAGVAFEAGSVAQPTLIVIDQTPESFGQHCAGPLSTSLCQYPLFYRFEEFPHVRLLKGARVGVCHVNTGSFAPPEGIHDRFRLAHEAPEIPSPEGTIVDGIEILKLISVADFMVCTDVSYQIASTSGNPFIRGGLAAMNGVLSAARWVFTPKTAYAIDGGGGGFAFDFSHFNVVDPIPTPSIDFETFPGGASTSPSCDAPCDLSTQYANLGATFDFIPALTGDPLGHASMYLNSWTGPSTHTATNAANTDGGGFFTGTLIMRFSNATSVTFTLRENNTSATVPVNAFGTTFEGPPPPIPGSQITRTVTGAALPAGCTSVCFREERITVTNASGISRIDLPGGAFQLLVDDITIVSPPPPPPVP
jgi:hypothetical protein